MKPQHKWKEISGLDSQGGGYQCLDCGLQVFSLVKRSPTNEGECPQYNLPGKERPKTVSLSEMFNRVLAEEIDK